MGDFTENMTGLIPPIVMGGVAMRFADRMIPKPKSRKGKRSKRKSRNSPW